MVLIAAMGSRRSGQPGGTYFRPLAGIMVLINSDLYRGMITPVCNVSVPLRGLWFLSVVIIIFNIITITAVSVPLRGLWFLSHGYTLSFDYIRNRFPSPCGDYGSYRVKRPRVSARGLLSFPSPCGDYGSYLFKMDCSGCQLLVTRFRPLAGIMVLIGAYENTHHFSKRGSFRPLAGIMVLIRTLYKWLYEAVEMAFCGADHIFSLFFAFCKKMIFKKSFRTEF